MANILPLQMPPKNQYGIFCHYKVQVYLEDHINLSQYSLLCLPPRKGTFIPFSSMNQILSADFSPKFPNFFGGEN